MVPGDLGDLMRRVVKYMVEGLIVGAVAYAVPRKQLNLDEILTLALVAACTFSILDTFVPTISTSVRSGAGFVIGANLVGFPFLG